uniref:Mannosyltransferase n=1 Tax=Kalanchoe fedtschenkoi TaxID=63787 RepID=A0A7N0TYA1_KALFE
MRRRGSLATGALGGEKEELDYSVEEVTRIQSRGFISSTKRVFVLCLVFRVVNSLLVQTYFNPDEHWQALEVAHRVTFGYGHLTWEWKKGLRSYLHPLVFALLYKLLELCHLDTPWFMLTNWFMFFCFPRTLSNSLETVVTLLSLFYWPSLRVKSCEQQSASRKWALILAALACAIRPTSAIIWLYVGILEFFLTQDKWRFIFLETIPIGALVLLLTFLLDRLFYGLWVLVPLNFLKFNFLSSGGDYYGTHAWHWYFSQGFSAMLFTFLPFSLAGIFQSKQWKLSGLIAWVLVLYSVLGHKEFRFVLPVLPLALLFSGYSLAALGDNLSQRNRKRSSKTHKKSCLKLKLSVLFLLVTNIPMALYMSMIHQRGTEDAMDFLSREAIIGKVQSVLFLMPCHATPYYSMLHRNLPMRFLDCTPSEGEGVLDESDRFLADPVGFTTQYFKNSSLPSHILLFESEEKQLKEFLRSHSYIGMKRFFHAHFKVDRDLQASVVVYTLHMDEKISISSQATL